MYIVTLKQGKIVAAITAYLSSTIAYNSIEQWLGMDEFGRLEHTAKICFVPASSASVASS
jgi:thymidylate kinase